ncbi:MAG: ABC transporter permease [Calditrichaeota bacterium]|nr:MAG: ABC transporter permease [Calditrichota bacterium]
MSRAYGFSASITGTSAVFRNRLTLCALIYIVMLTGLSYLSPLIMPYHPEEQGDLVYERYLPPSLQHPFGTDKFARDIFSRVFYGGRISLTIAFISVFLAVTIGILYGSISAYWGGVVDTILMRILDFLLAIPPLFLFITIAALFSVNIWGLILLLSFTGWMEIARLIRGEALSIKEREFILAAKGLGFSKIRIVLRHLIPNCLTPVMAAIPMKMAEVILIESALSFLGIGVQPPTPSWGNIINDGREALMYAWWISTIPGVFIAATVMSFNIIGEGLQKVLERSI